MHTVHKDYSFDKSCILMNRAYYFWSNTVFVKSNEPGKNSYFPKFLVKCYMLKNQILECINYKVTPLMSPYSHFTMHLSILLVIFFNMSKRQYSKKKKKKKRVRFTDLYNSFILKCIWTFNLQKA